MKEENAPLNSKEERRKIVGIMLIMFILILYVVSLISKIYKKQDGDNIKKERVEQILNQLEDEFTKPEK